MKRPRTLVSGGVVIAASVKSSVAVATFVAGHTLPENSYSRHTSIKSERKVAGSQI